MTLNGAPTVLPYINSDIMLTSDGRYAVSAHFYLSNKRDIGVISKYVTFSGSHSLHISR